MTNNAPKVAPRTTKIDAKALDESGLVAALLQRDEPAWCEFVRRYEPELRKDVKRSVTKAMRSILDSDCIDDVIQDFYVDLLEGDMKKLRYWANSPKTELPFFLGMLVRQVAIEHIRKAFRDTRLLIEMPIPAKDTDANRGADWLGMEQAERVPLDQELPKKRRRRREREVE